VTPTLANASDDRQRVLDATDIVRLIGEEIALKPKGREYVCLCPFHDDHNPSCYVVPHKQIFHCFVCGAGGNAIDFIMKRHQLGFRETLQLLADRAGIELTPLRKPAGASRSSEPAVSKQDVAEAGAFALDFFRTILRHDAHGAEARAAIERRGVSPEMVDAFELGAAPDRWDGLLQTIERRKLDPAPFLAAGLLKKRESGGLYDAFRHRWIFPIRDSLGRVVAFGGRKLREEDEPKYLNSAETPIFDKSATCYGLPQASERIRATSRAIVVEGYTDVIACHQAGETNVVATLGTATTTKHARILRRLASEIILVFDGDDAGQRAADRALEVFFAEPVDVRIAVLPGGADPADLLSGDDGVAAWQAAIDAAADALDYRFARLREKLAPLSPTARTRAVEEDVAHLQSLGLARLSPIRRQTVVRRLAQLAGVDESAVAAAFRAAPARRAPVRVEASAADAEPIRDPAGPAEHLLGALFAAPALLDLLDQDAARRLEAAAAERGPVAAALARYVAEAAAADAPPLDLLRDLAVERDRAAAIHWSRHVERICEREPARIRAHAEGCLARLARLPSSSADPAQDQTDPLQRINTLRKLGGNPAALAPPGTTG
jgi:DNA primase